MSFPCYNEIVDGHTNIKNRRNLESAQERQDDIFRRMSADQKVAVGSLLWRLAKDLAGEKITYGTDRPPAPPGQDRGDS